MKNIHLSKIEEVKYLEQNSNEVEREQRIADGYNFESDSYSDISSSKVYGPMYRASAGRSVNERFTPLKIPCLEANCNDTVASERLYSGCGGVFQISNWGNLKCNGCPLVGDIKEFAFRCSKDSGYVKANNQMDIGALKRVLFRAVGEGAMDENITMELIQHLNNNS